MILRGRSVGNASFCRELCALGISLWWCMAEARIWVVNQQDPRAADCSEGTLDQPFKTIQAAAERAEAGDVVRVYSGTYRERVLPQRSGSEAHPIVYEGAPGAHVVVKGSELWKNPWKPLESHVGIYTSEIDATLFATQPNPYRTPLLVSPDSVKSEPARPIAAEHLSKPWPRTLGDLFVDGEPYTQVQSMAMLSRAEKSWLVNAEGTAIHLHVAQGLRPLQTVQIEWSVRNRLFAPQKRGLKYIHVKGFTFMHCANQGPFPQCGAVSSRSGKYWLFEGNTIRFAKTIGLDIGAESWDGAHLPDTLPEDRRLIVQASHIVRNNEISDNGLCGIAGWSATDCVIYNNVLERNNRLSLSSADAQWEEWAAIKLHGSNAIIAHNTIRFNEGHGIWFDNGYDRARITGNAILNNTLSGVMIELGAGHVLIDNNIIAFTRGVGDFYEGNGIYAHDASGITVAHNLLLANQGAGVLMRTTGPTRRYGDKPVETSNETICNNLFYANAKGALCMPYHNRVAQNNTSDYNAFIGKTFFRINKLGADTFTWSEVAQKLGHTNAMQEAFDALSLDAWRKLMGWDAHSVAEPKVPLWNILPYRMVARGTVPAVVARMTCPAVDEMTCDFFGVRMAADQFVDDLPALRAKPGPWQDLAEGAFETTVQPWQSEGLPQVRQKLEERRRCAAAERLERALKAVPQPRGTTKTTYELDFSNALWCVAQQEPVNPEITTPLTQQEPVTTRELAARSTAGVSASPASCLVFTVPETGYYTIALQARLTKRQAETAGFARLSLLQLDASGEQGKTVFSIDLNTPKGYRGTVLPAETKQTLRVPACAGHRFVLRVQIIAPGPAGAGSGTLEIEQLSAMLER